MNLFVFQGSSDLMHMLNTTPLMLFMGYDGTLMVAHATRFQLSIIGIAIKKRLALELCSDTE